MDILTSDNDGLNHCTDPSLSEMPHYAEGEEVINNCTEIEGVK